jgi:CRISPR system Cascade subunit CasE
MFFSRITIDTRSADPDDLVALVKGNVYAIHQVLWRLFPENPYAKRDFLFRKEEGTGWPYFYVVSKRHPQSLNGFVQVETKAYQPKLTEGQMLAFSLRANPVVTKKSADGCKRIRHDVVMNAKHDLALSTTGKTTISTGELQFNSGIKWLEDRCGKLGFDFDPKKIRVFGYQQHRIKRRNRKSYIQFSSLDYNGILTVIDSDRFCKTLMSGIGRSKAFGCGLMLVRRL